MEAHWAAAPSPRLTAAHAVSDFPLTMHDLPAHRRTLLGKPAREASNPRGSGRFKLPARSPPTKTTPKDHTKRVALGARVLDVTRRLRSLKQPLTPPQDRQETSQRPSSTRESDAGIAWAGKRSCRTQCNMHSSRPEFIKFHRKGFFKMLGPRIWPRSSTLSNSADLFYC